MNRLPVIVGFGGYNAAGRSSFHHGFRRMIIDSVPSADKEETLRGLSTLMNLARWEGGSYTNAKGEVLQEQDLASTFSEQALSGTLVRQFQPIIQSEYTDAFYEKIAVNTAGQLPEGFDPGEHYRSQYHPRGLQMSIMGASDAIKSIGIPWDDILDQISPDQVSVYSGSGMTQADDLGTRGLMQSRLLGKRITPKLLPLSLNSMPTDFMNAYMLGSLGASSTSTAACATFLHNLKRGVDDIRSGRCRVALIGNAEAPLTPEIMDGYAAMGALATDLNLRTLDQSDNINHRSASRPFGENCGFTIAESCQFTVLMDDAFAVEIGAQIHGAIADIFLNADGFKRSISAPGAGNYLTLGRAVASAKAILGAEAVQQRSWIHTHGSSTPQNRVTEANIINKVAEAFHVNKWHISAVKSYVGHPLTPASGDQLMSALGSFKYHTLPGIKTIDAVADDVDTQHIEIPLQDKQVDPMDVAFINSKGFGGSNASAVILSPNVVMTMLEKRHGQQAMASYEAKRELSKAGANEYEQQALKGMLNPTYRFGEKLIDEEQLEMTSTTIKIPGYKKAVSLDMENPYKDMV